jgi:hypothetical protein
MRRIGQADGISQQTIATGSRLVLELTPIPGMRENLEQTLVPIFSEQTEEWIA